MAASWAGSFTHRHRCFPADTYDGVNAIAEYDAANAVQRRYVFGPGVDEPIVQYDAAGTRTWLLADERGSIVSSSDDSGNLIAVNAYDEYGRPGASNVGRYQYTGQKWIGEAGLYDYKFRDYLPHFGIFAQTDPIGYEDSANLYAYVLNDPINFVDPLGLDEWVNCIGDCGGVDFSRSIEIVGRRLPENHPPITTNPWALQDIQSLASPEPPIVVTGKRPKPRDPIVITGKRIPAPVQIATNPYDFSGPYGFLRWYVDQLKGGLEHEKRRAREFEEQCLSGENDVDWGRVASDAAEGAGRSVGLKFGWDKVVGGALGGWRSYIGRALSGSLWGGAKSYARQRCGS